MTTEDLSNKVCILGTCKIGNLSMSYSYIK